MRDLDIILSRKQMDILLAAIDEDGDGRIELEEFMLQVDPRFNKEPAAGAGLLCSGHGRQKIEDDKLLPYFEGEEDAWYESLADDEDGGEASAMSATTATGGGGSIVSSQRSGGGGRAVAGGPGQKDGSSPFGQTMHLTIVQNEARRQRQMGYNGVRTPRFKLAQFSGASQRRVATPALGAVGQIFRFLRQRRLKIVDVRRDPLTEDGNLE